eukprot:887061_1
MLVPFGVICFLAVPVLGIRFELPVKSERCFYEIVGEYERGQAEYTVYPKEAHSSILIDFVNDEEQSVYPHEAQNKTVYFDLESDDQYEMCIYNNWRRTVDIDFAVILTMDELDEEREVGSVMVLESDRLRDVQQQLKKISHSAHHLLKDVAASKRTKSGGGELINTIGNRIMFLGIGSLALLGFLHYYMVT